jgi:D-glycero-alpha-D-manno-heptose-7-phosphate kinase
MTQPDETRTIIARAPVRVSFGGGGTDLNVYYEKHGGFVLSTTINRYCHVFARPARDGGVHINSADYRVWQSFRRGQIPQVAEPLSLPKAVLEWFLQQDSPERLLPGGVKLFLASEVDGGTGLGSSSAMTVALIQALVALAQAHGSDLSLSVEELAELACHIEIERLQMPIGKQDQYASAFGSLNTISFSAEQVTVEPLPISPRLRDALQMRLMLFSTGRTHDSGDILRRQRSNTEKEPLVLERLHRMKEMAKEMCDALTAHDLDRFGLLLHESWLAKKQLSNAISNNAIDQWYEAARMAGALGGKISGAGGGGFLLLYCPLNRQRAVREQLHSLGLQEMPFCFSEGGATVTTTSPAAHAQANDRYYAAPLPQRQQEGTQQIAAYWEQQAAINRQMPLQAIAQAAGLLRDCRRRQGTVYVAGHGGSASTASHFARADFWAS